MPKCYILIGLPGVGKTTWIKNQGLKDCIHSSDMYVDAIAFTFGYTYDEIFNDVIKFADRMFWDDIKAAPELGTHVVIDHRTNLSVKSRKKFIDFLKPYGYTFEAIVFPTPDETEWRRRLNSRLGKTIPEDVLKSMRYSYEMPLPNEGFDEITYM